MLDPDEMLPQDTVSVVKETVAGTPGARHQGAKGSMFKRVSDGDEVRATIVRCMDEMQLKQDANVAAWGLGNTERWNADWEHGDIYFTRRDGVVVTAPVQIIGTFSTEDETWLWGWDHPLVKERLANGARLCREFGEKYGLRQFTDRKIACSEDEAWEFTAVALHLSGGVGAYRAPSDSRLIFMTFGEVTIQKVS